MKLRVRLALAGVLILAVISFGSLAILTSQEQYLVGQLDEQLHVTRPLLRPPPDHDNTDQSPDNQSPSDQSPSDQSPSEQTPSEQSRPGGADRTPVSNLYMAEIVDDQVTTILQGQLLDDSPSIDAASLNSETTKALVPFNLSAQQGTTRFRAIVIDSTETNSRFVVAIPRSEVDQAIGQLRNVLIVGGITIGAVLALCAWWVDRLSLRPVAHVTDVAEAITKGARGLRAEQTSKATEANQLAAAFNIMLDEHDATEQRLRSFISDASHELRTPLTSIRGYLDLYSDGAFREEGELDDVVRRLQRESARMQSLVEDLLLLAKLDERPVMRSESVDLGLLLSDAAADAAVLQPDRPITVEVCAPTLTCEGDALRLQQVVGILVSNALTHTGPDVSLKLRGYESGDGQVIEVSDTGPGLDPTKADKVFNRFYRGDPSRARSTGGSGLGLAIAKSLVEAHNGEIHLKTAPGKGCTFTVTLPAKPAVSTS